MDDLTGSICTSFCGTSNSSYGSINDLSMNSFLGISRSLLLCIKDGFIVCISGLFLITFLARLVFKGSRQMDTITRPTNLSCLHILLPLILNLGMGTAYIGLGIWLLQEEWSTVGQIIIPLVLFLQGVTWILLSLTMGVRSNTLPRGLLKLLSFFMILYAAGLLFVNTILTLIGGTKLSPRSILDLLSLPGSFLLLLSASKQSSSREYYGGRANDNTTCLLLNTESERIKDGESDDQCVTTGFDGAPLLSRLTFWWLNPLMRKGRYSPLEENDVPQLGVVDKAEYCYERFSNASNHEKDKKLRSTSMFWMLVSCHSKEIIVSGLFALLKILTLSAGPLLLNTFVKLSEGEEGFKHEGYVLAVSMFFAKGLESVSQRQWYFRARRIGLQVRSALSAAVYKKQLRLSNEGKLKHSSGEIMNYMTVDTYRIGEFPFWFHQSWTTSLQLVLALAIVSRAIGLATISALVVIVLTVVCNSPLAKLQHKFQTKLMEAQDERLKVISEALVNMKVLKLYAWETHFKNVIEGLRKVEVKWLSAFQIRRAYNSFLFWTSPVLVSAATFGTCYFLKVHLEPSNVFTFVATLRLVQDPIRTIPDVIGAFIQANVALSRIANFLEAPELENEYCKQILTKEHEFSVHIMNASFSWEGGLLKPNLRNINLAARPGQKIAVCGEVGSGKSTLLAAILGEVANVHGALQVCGVIAYVSQTAWIQTGTIRENILFGSSMDGRRYKQVIENCSLAKDLEMMPYGDCTEIGERGVNLSGGQKQRIQLARAVYQDADIYLLDDPFSAVDAHTSSSLFNDCIMGALSEKTVLLVTHQTEFLPFFDSILLMSDGVILHSDTYDELLASSAEFQALVNAQKDSMSSEKLAEVVSFQANDSVPLSVNKRQQYNEQNMNLPAVVSEQLIKREQRERGDSGFKPYIQYLNQNKGFLYFSLVALSHLTFISSQILQNSWMAANVQNPHVSTLKLISIYCIIGCVGAIFLLARSLFVVTLGLQSSISSFSQLLTSLFRAPMSFYDATPLGRILSRISADMGIVDLDIPFSLTFTVSSTINTYSNLGVLATITWPILFMAIPVIYCSIRLQRYYFSTAKELMRINGTTKSLVANHLSESIAGTMTIRAFKQENRYFTKSLEVIDKNASPFFHNFAANEWLIERLETLSAAVLSSSALVMATLPPGTFSAGYIGMALSYGLSLNMSLVGSIRNQCTLANHIISVERINQYMHLSSEAPEVIEGSLPAPNWPDVGEVCIQNLKIKYRPNTQLVLHGISCTFQGGDKIGIVGRTGSGKSTLISALFRLVEPTDGKIFIDGVDISKVGLHDLRSRLGIIPQDPTLFLGSVRYNLDPLNKHSDREIWEVLQKCQLHEAVQEKKDGLDSLVVEDGSNWSMGQRQLFCLGRALLRKSKILVLDEATASIDNATDAILQDTIRREFADSTVITVAHRIPTVMNCTMVLAISDGKLAEYDEPMKLMSREGSLFRELVREYFSHTNSGIFAANL